MAKKPLSAKQKQTRYRALQYSTFVAEYVSIIMPFVILGAINYEDWFVGENGWKVGLGGTLALALLGIAVLLITRKKEDTTITSGYIALVIGWFGAAFVFVLLAEIIEQIATIMFFGGIGILGAFGLDMTSKNFKTKADKYKTSIEKAKSNVIEQEVEQEIKESDVRF